MANRTMNDYEKELNALLDDLLGGSFQYDYTQDPVYQQYAAEYTREGDRAAENAYGIAASRTGGYGSSYAVTAATQANNVYRSALADKVPELYQAAYERYADDYDRKQEYATFLYQLGNEYYDRQLKKAETQAKRGDWTGYKALGYTDEEIRRLRGW